MPGILDRMACGVALALAIGGRAAAADPPRRQKNGSFLRGSVWGKGREPKKAEHQEEICFLVIF